MRSERGATYLTCEWSDCVFCGAFCSRKQTTSVGNDRTSLKWFRFDVKQAHDWHPHIVWKADVFEDTPGGMKPKLDPAREKSVKTTLFLFPFQPVDFSFVVFVWRGPKFKSLRLWTRMWLICKYLVRCWKNGLLSKWKHAGAKFRSWTPSESLTSPLVFWQNLKS